LDHGLGAEHAGYRLAEPLGPIDDAEESLLVPKPALHQVAEEGGTHLLVLRAGLDEAEEDLLARHGDPEGQHHFVLGEGLPVEEEGGNVVAVQPALQEGAELPGRGWKRGVSSQEDRNSGFSREPQIEASMYF
jgi:hypothetical protein